MTIHLDSGAAESCTNACAEFAFEIDKLSSGEYITGQPSGGRAFPTARQLGAVYSLFAGEDLQTLLNGFISQAEAMSILFAAAGGLIEAQDEAVASALGKASAEPAGLQSLGLLAVPGAGSLGSLTGMIDASTDAVGGYERVGYENVDGATLDWMVSGAQALDPQEFEAIRARAIKVAAGLRTAGGALHRGLTDQLNGPWQGEFATQALASLTPFSQSVTDLADVLDEVGDKASDIGNGFGATQRQMTETAAAYDSARTNALADDATAPSLLPPSGDAQADLVRSRAAAEQQARAIINHEYSPAVMRGNLADLDIPAPYRVVALPSLGGPGGVDLVSAWNVDGVIRPATAAAPTAAALAAASGGGAGADLGTAGGGAAGGAGIGATTSPPATPTDAATEQALLASRAGAVDGAGAVAPSAGQAGSGGGVNASTTAAGAPFAPAGAAGGQQSSAGAGGIRGIRGAGNPGRDRDRGFGSAAGMVGGGGAAAAGAAASRLGGAGTLAGIGGGAGLSGGAGAAGGSAGAGAFGAGSAGPGAAGSGAGAVSSSSGGAQAGRAGAMPMGAMAGGAGAGQNSDRRGHTPAGYLTNATNTTAIIGEPLKVSPAVLGRKPVVDPSAHEAAPEPFRGRVIGRDYTGRGAR